MPIDFSRPFICPRCLLMKRGCCFSAKSKNWVAAVTLANSGSNSREVAFSNPTKRSACYIIHTCGLLPYEEAGWEREKPTLIFAQTNPGQNRNKRDSMSLNLTAETKQWEHHLASSRGAPKDNCSWALVNILNPEFCDPGIWCTDYIVTVIQGCLSSTRILAVWGTKQLGAGNTTAS